MPTLPTTTAPAASTSTTATAPEPKQAPRLSVRLRQQPALYTAYQLTARTPLDLPLQSGRKVLGEPGDWVVTQKDMIIEVLPADIFRHQYEPAQADSLTISGKDRTAIEQILGIGSTLDAARLVGSITRLARLEIGGVVLDFTPGQWEELHHRAEKRGITTENLVKQIVARITSEIWSV